jgi:hypothetical protein
MPDQPLNKYRAAIEILQRGRNLLVENLTDEVLNQCENLVEGGFQFNEFLESHGTRLHFLGLIVSQLELSAEMLDEARSEASQPVPPAVPPITSSTKRRPRTRAPRPPGPRRRSSREKPIDDVPF